MEYQLYGNSDILLNDSPSNSKSSWNLPSDSSMDNNDEYFGWNSLKIDEQKFQENSKGTRKRRLSTSSEERKMKQSYAGTNDPLSLEKSHNETKKVSPLKGAARMPQWRVEDYDDLNTDIEGSLSLGTELANNEYNVSDSLLALNEMPVFKQEAPSPTSNEITQLQIVRQNRLSPSSTSKMPLTNTVNSTMEDNNSENIFNSTINQLLSQTALANLHVMDSTNLATSPTNSQDNFAVSSTNYNLVEDYRFQYVLAAATSIATKQNEDTLTYLNQGQSYEIKLKKLGDLSMYRGKMLKSVIRICFHERRLQYMEKEQMISWQKARPGDRILEVDVPLSYGAFNIFQPTNALNVIHFEWDPTKEVGVYIKVNCISTEFTPKKHGGEKGVPFRIQVETYKSGECRDPTKRLHAAACQIKVFKLKGADRKHKQDREKIMKRPLCEQEKYQPSYECTMLNDIPSDAVVTTPMGPAINSLSPAESNPPTHKNQLSPKAAENDIHSNGTVVLAQKPVALPNPLIGHVEKKENDTNDLLNNQLSPEASVEETSQWLIVNRFEKYLQVFSRFAGSDMLRMSREDFIQICGHADGIRLYNILHLRTVAPKLKMYICRDNSSVFNAVFLSSHSSCELLQKLSALIGISQEQVRDIYVEGPQSIHVLLNDDVLRHLEEETMFSLEVLQENKFYVLLLKRKVS